MRDSWTICCPSRKSQAQVSCDPFHLLPLPSSSLLLTFPNISTMSHTCCILFSSSLLLFELALLLAEFATEFLRSSRSRFGDVRCSRDRCGRLPVKQSWQQLWLQHQHSRTWETSTWQRCLAEISGAQLHSGNRMGLHMSSSTHCFPVHQEQMAARTPLPLHLLVMSQRRSHHCCGHRQRRLKREATAD